MQTYMYLIDSACTYPTCIDLLESDPIRDGICCLHFGYVGVGEITIQLGEIYCDRPQPARECGVNG